MKTEEELSILSKQFKASNKGSFQIRVPIEFDEFTEEANKWATIFVRKPVRNEVMNMEDFISQKNKYKALEYYLKSCYLGGDELDLILNNDDAFFACENSVAEIIVKRVSQLKKN
jgi:hypothetical protein